MKKQSKTLREKIIDADTRANQWLSLANEKEEQGNRNAALACEKKAQYWLDRLNKLEGIG